MKILALLDGRPGNDNQTLAIAEKLGDFQKLKIEFTSLAKLPNFLLGTSLIGVKTSLDDIEPQIVISAGRKLARVARHIKKKTGCVAIQLMWPGSGNKDFDIIFTPMHDGHFGKPNVIETIGAPNRIDNDMLSRHSTPLNVSGRVAMLVGDVEPKEIPTNIDSKKLHITTSRRTKPKTLKALKSLEPASLYDWSSEEENPYYSLLSTADKIVVSADSIGMISEACTTGKPVYIFGTAKKPKFKKFQRYLMHNNYVKPIEEFKGNWKPNKLSTRDEIIEVLRG